MGWWYTYIEGVSFMYSMCMCMFDPPKFSRDPILTCQSRKPLFYWHEMTMQVNPQIDITHQCLTKLSNYCENTYSSSIDTHGVQNGANLEEKANNFC